MHLLAVLGRVRDEDHVCAVGRPFVSHDLLARMAELARLAAAAVENPKLCWPVRGSGCQEADVSTVWTESGLVDTIPACDLNAFATNPRGDPQRAAAFIGRLVVARDQVGYGGTVRGDLQIRKSLESVPVLGSQCPARMRGNRDRQGG